MKQFSNLCFLLHERLVRVGGLWLLLLIAQTAGAKTAGEIPPGAKPSGGQVAPKAITLGNRVFKDYNRNGIQDAGEASGVSGLPLRLYQNGILRGTTTTDADGQYAFTDANVTGGLQPNTSYEIRVATANLPAGYSLTKRAQGSDKEQDSDAKVIGNQIVVALITDAPTEPNDSYDIGLAAGNPDLVLTKTANVSSVSLGSNITFTIAVQNTSADGVANNVVIRDTLDAGLAYISSSPAATISTTPSSQTVLTWTLGTMLGGASQSVNLTVKTTSEGIVYNTAYVTTTDTENTTLNNVSRAGVSVPIKMCPGEEYVASLPVQYTNVKWYRNAEATPVATGNSFTITQAGSYSFTTTANVDCPANGCVPIIIEDGIVPELTIARSATAICVGQEATLTANGCGTGTIQWSTGAGTASITVAPTSTTAYSFTCTSNTYGTCTSSVSTTVTVNPNPVVTLSSTTICAGSTATLTATSNLNGSTFLFSEGLTQVGGATGNTATLATSVSAAASTTTYSVTAISTEGCSTTATGSITVNPNPVVTLSSATICAGQTASLTVTSGFASYTFSEGLTQVGGTSGNTASLTTQAGAASSTTVYSVTAQSAEGCTSTASGTIVVNANPVVSLSSATICAGSTATLVASQGYASYVFSEGLTQVGGASSNTATISTSTSAVGSTTAYSVTAISAEGCSGVGSGTVVVNPNPVVTLSSTTICAGSTATLTATSNLNGSTFLFSEGLTQVGGATGNTATVSTSANAANSTTVYSVTAISPEGCTSTASGTVVINANPVASISVSSATICAGSSSVLTASGGSSYSWSTGETTAAISVTSTGVYTVTANSGAGCSDVASTTVTVNPTPQLTVDSATLCAGMSTTLVLGGWEGGTIRWSTGDNTASLAIEPLVTTTYSATCTFSTGCSATISSVITVNEAPTFETAPIVKLATCNGATANNDARFDFTTLQNVVAADIVEGSSYGSGPAFGAATNKAVVSGAVSFTGIANPTEPTTYTVRLFSAGGTCVTDVVVTLEPAICECPAPKCVPVLVQKIR